MPEAKGLAAMPMEWGRGEWGGRTFALRRVEGSVLWVVWEVRALEAEVVEGWLSFRRCLDATVCAPVGCAVVAHVVVSPRGKSSALSRGDSRGV